MRKLITLLICLGLAVPHSGYSQNEATELADKGIGLFLKFQFDSAVYFIQQALPELKEAELWDKYFECQYYQSAYYFVRGRNAQQALDSMNANLELALEKSGETSSGVGEMYFGLGWLNDNATRDRVTAADYYLKSLEIWEAHFGRNHKKTGKAYANYVLSLYNLGRLGEAEGYLTKALNIYSEIYDQYDTEWGRLYNSAFYYYNGLRQYDKASTYAHAMYQLSTNNPSIGIQWYQRACRNLTMTYYNLQDYERAAKYSLEELEVGKDIMNEVQLSGVYNNLGRIFLFLDRSKVLDYTKKARELKVGTLGPNHPLTISSDINIASATTDLVSPAQSVPMYRKILANESLAESAENEVRTWWLLTKAQNLTRSWTESVQTFQKVEEKYFERSGGVVSNDLLFNFYANASNYAISSHIELFLENGDPASLLEGKVIFDRMDSLMSYNWGNLEYAADQSSFLNLTNEFYVAGSDLFYYLFATTGEQEFANQFLYTSEKRKASMSFPAYLLAMKKDQLDIPAEILEFKKNLNTEIAQMDYDPEGDKELLVIKKAQRDSLVQVIKDEYPAYYAERMFDHRITAQDVQDQLEDDETAIIYVTNKITPVDLKSTIFTVAVNKDGVEMWRNEVEDLPSKVEDFISGVKEKQESKDLSSELFTALSLDSALNVATGNSLVVIPNNELFYLPFDLIRDSTGKALIENYTVRYLPSASMMLNLGGENVVRTTSLFAPQLQPGATENALATRGADELEPLFNSVQEVDNIGGIIGGSRLSGLSKASLLDQLSNADIIHLATHAEVSHATPGSSALYLSNSRDSSIYAYELYNQTFKAKLVTLSACNTGVGKMQSGEGIQSLGKAFTYAGCPNIVMSLWPVNDESTAELMTSFYQNLKDGMRKDEALRQAKLTYIENADPVKAHPYYWAGFVFSGDPEPLTFESRNEFLWVLLVVAAVFMMGYFVRRKNHKASSN